MNRHSPLKAEAAVSDSLKLVTTDASYEIETAARVLYHAAVMLRATPRHPDCNEMYAGRLAYFNEAVADMKDALNG